MADGLSIKIQTQLESSSEIESKLSKILSKINTKIKISDIDIDTKAIEKIQNLLSGLGSGKNVSLPLLELKNVLNDLQKIKINGESMIALPTDKFNSFQSKIQETEREIQKLKVELNNLNSTSRNPIKSPISTEEVTKLENAIKLYQTKMANSIQNLNSAFGKHVPTNEIDAFKRKLSELGNINSIKELQAQMKTLNNEFGSITANARSMMSAHYGILSNLKHSLTMFSQFYVVGGIVTTFTNGIKEGFNYIKQMDDAQTNIQMITGRTKQEVQNLTSEYKQLAKELSTTNDEIMSGAEEYLRSGYSDSETLSMLKAGTIGSKISGQSNEDTAQELIAIKNAYDMTGDSVMKVVDTISTLDNTSSTSFKEIATALKYCSFSAQQVGVSFEDMSSIIAVTSSKTRLSAETIGQAYKTIFTRFSDVQTGKLEDENGDPLSLNATEKALSKVGIAIRTDETHFRNFNDVLQELGGKWKNIDSQVDKSAILKALAGTRQSNILSALLQNMDDLNTMQNAVVDSAGNAEKKFNEVYSDSLDAKINRLKQSVQNLYDTFLNSSMAKSGVGVLQSMVNGLQALGNASTSSKLALIGFSSILIIMLSNLKMVVLELATTPVKLTAIQMASLTLTGGVGVLQSAFVGLKTTLVTLFATPWGIAFLAIVGVLGAVTYAVTKHIQKEQEHQKAISDTKTAYDNLNKSMKENSITEDSSDLKTLKDSQDKLQKAIKEREEAQKILDEANKSNKTPNNSGYNGYIDKSSSTPTYNGSIANYGNTLGEATRKVEVANKAIKEQTDVLDKAGVQYDATSGKIEKIAEAENLLNAKSTVDKIKEETKYNYDHQIGMEQMRQEYDNYLNTLSSAYNEYNQLTQQENLSIQQKTRLSEVIKILDNNVSGLSVTTDDNGKSMINNISLVGSQIDAYTSEGFSLNTVQGVRIAEAKTQNEAEMSKTDSTYKNVLQRIQYYQAELDALNKLSVGADASDAVMSRAKADASYNKSQAEKDLDDLKKQYDKVFDTNMPSISAPTNTSSFTPSDTSGATNKNTQATNASKEANDQYSLSMQNLNNKLDEYDNKLKNVSKSSQEYRNILLEKQKLIQQEISLTQQQVNLQNQLAKSGGGSSTSVASSIATSTGNSLGQQLISEANKYLGTPYVWGGTTPSGFDCSGFVQYVYKQLGVALTRDTYHQVKEGVKIDRSQLQVGDLVFFGDPSAPHHVGIYAGNNQIVHSPTDGQSVKYSNMDAFGETMTYRRVANTGGTSTSSTSSDTTVQDAQQKSLDLQNKLLDLQQQLAEIPYQIFESRIAEYDDKVTELEKRNDIIKNDLELETDGKKRADKSTEIITNLEKELEINKEKQKYVEQEIASRNYTNTQLTEMNSKLLDIKKTETDIAVQVKQAYEDQLNTVKTVQEKIMEVIKKRYEEEKDLIQKQQDAYNKQNETDDYNKNLADEQKKLADIQKKIDMIKNDPTAKGKLADLMKEATDQQKSIDDMVLEHQRSLNNEMFDAQKDAIDEKAKDENLTQIVNNAISQGFINLDGKIIDVKTAYIDFENRFGEGLKATGELIKTEFINQLSEAQSLIGSMQNINLKINATSGGGASVPSYDVGTTNIPADTLAMVHAGESIIPASINPFNGSNFINMIRNQVAFAISGIRTPSINGTSKGNIEINMNQPFLVVQGNIDESMKGYLTNLMNNKMKDFTNEIKAICNSEGVY